MTASEDSPREPTNVRERVESIDWARAHRELEAHGCTVLDGVLPRADCLDLTALYARDELFRNRVVMAQHGFGRGEYKYFAYPLPSLVTELRSRLYPKLVPIANRWNRDLGFEIEFPADHADFLELCCAAGQARPTPLLLSYEAGDFNCLHQDIYGDLVFPIQIAILLSEPGRDFTGGEFVMTEQRPRMQSRPMVLPLCQGDAALFAVRHRPVQGVRGFYRVHLRHGVSRVRTGRRYTLGVIFHDAS